MKSSMSKEASKDGMSKSSIEANGENPREVITEVEDAFKTEPTPGGVAQNLRTDTNSESELKDPFIDPRDVKREIAVAPNSGGDVYVPNDSSEGHSRIGFDVKLKKLSEDKHD